LSLVCVKLPTSEAVPLLIAKENFCIWFRPVPPLLYPCVEEECPPEESMMSSKSPPVSTEFPSDAKAFFVIPVFP